MYMCNAQSNMMLGFFLNEFEISIAESHQVRLWAGRCMTRGWVLCTSKWTRPTNKYSPLNVLKSVAMSAVAQVLCVYDNKSGHFVYSVICTQDLYHILLDKFCLWTSYPCKTNASWTDNCLSVSERYIFQKTTIFTMKEDSQIKDIYTITCNSSQGRRKVLKSDMLPHTV